VLTQAAPPARAWQSGTVADISDERVYAGSEKTPGDVNGGTSARYRHVWTYTIDVGNAVYVIRGDCGKIFPAPCRLAVNGPVQIAISNKPAPFFARGDGDPIYLKDDSGKEYTLSVAKKTIKPAVKQP
jgi:hypothetical protein